MAEYRKDEAKNVDRESMRGQRATLMAVSTPDDDIDETGLRSNIRRIEPLGTRGGGSSNRKPLRARWGVLAGIVVLIVAACGERETSEERTGASPPPAAVQVQTQPAPTAALKTTEGVSGAKTGPASTPTPGATPEAPAGPSPKVENSVGDLAPDFRLDTVGGGEVTLADFQGKPLVIYFFATW